MGVSCSIYERGVSGIQDKTLRIPTRVRDTLLSRENAQPTRK